MLWMRSSTGDDRPDRRMNSWFHRQDGGMARDCGVADVPSAATSASESRIMIFCQIFAKNPREVLNPVHGVRHDRMLRRAVHTRRPACS
jgi:hypothetical protein